MNKFNTNKINELFKEQEEKGLLSAYRLNIPLSENQQNGDMLF